MSSIPAKTRPGLFFFAAWAWISINNAKGTTGSSAIVWEFKTGAESVPMDNVMAFESFCLFDFFFFRRGAPMTISGSLF